MKDCGLLQGHRLVEEVSGIDLPGCYHSHHLHLKPLLRVEILKLLQIYSILGKIVHLLPPGGHLWNFL
jgi:hypothetical protein